MAKQRTESFWVLHWVPKEKRFQPEKVRGYVRTFSHLETGNQIAIGIYRTGTKWTSVELSSGLRVETSDTLTEAFHIFQDDKLIERIWRALKDLKPGTPAGDAVETIRGLKEQD